MPVVTPLIRAMSCKNQKVRVKDLRMPFPHVLRDFVLQEMDFPSGIIDSFFKTGNF